MFIEGNREQNTGRVGSISQAEKKGAVESCSTGGRVLVLFISLE